MPSLHDIHTVFIFEWESSRTVVSPVINFKALIRACLSFWLKESTRALASVLPVSLALGLVVGTIMMLCHSSDSEGGDFDQG
jgi:hypothetical protein